MGTSASVTQPYNTLTGYTASTTGNISGIYDMAGGAWEYVMGYNTSANSVGGSSGITSVYGDFFTNIEWNKYYDKYTITSQTTYTKRILGDATGEMGPFESIKSPYGTSYNNSSWYNDFGFFITDTNPWFVRSGTWLYGSISGNFTYSTDTGGINTANSFRVILNTSNKSLIF